MVPRQVGPSVRPAAAVLDAMPGDRPGRRSRLQYALNDDVVVNAEVSEYLDNRSSGDDLHNLVCDSAFLVVA